MRRVLWVAATAAIFVVPARAWSQQQAPAQQQPPPASSQAQSQSSAQAPAPQESVAEAARRSREQKKEPAKPAKVFTNDNLPPVGGVNTVGTPSVESPGGEAPATGEEKPAQAGAGDEKTWREKFATLRQKLEKDKADLDVMQRELGVLDVQYYPDPVKGMQQSVTRSDINDKTAKIEAKKKEIEADQQAISDAEDALRKSGGDAGWAR
jgi:hypothetical protein